MSHPTPITSRIKRSPLLKYSPLKEGEDNDPKATAGGSMPGEDQTVTTTEERRKQSSIDFEKKCYNADGSRKRGVAGCTWADEEGKESPKETETITTTKTVPGEDTSWEGDLYSKKEFDVFQPWETRQMSRAIKKEQRDIRRAKKKLEKAKPGSPRYEEAQAELAEFEAMAERGKAARASGRKTGTSQVYAGQEKMDLAKLTPPEQKEQLKRQAAKKDNITTGDSVAEEPTGQASGAIEAGANPFANMAIDPSKYQLETPSTDYMELLYGKKPAPTKKALVGNQYKLPQHLQDKIKAAPGKMKTPLKKGYFKSK